MVKMEIIEVTESNFEDYQRMIKGISLSKCNIERSIIERYQKNRDPEAKSVIWQANQRCILACARQYQDQGLSLPDLVNISNQALFKAALHFNPDKNVKLISYAVWWIRRAILQALADKGVAVYEPPRQSPFKRFLERISKIFGSA